jgi:hypothetical protein
MAKNIEKKALGTWLKAQIALGNGDHERAIELFQEITDKHPDAQRYLALAFMDSEDMDRSITEFEVAYKKGDLKALPWLSYLIENNQEDNPQAQFLSNEVSRLIAENNPDVLLSAANIEMVYGDSAEACALWSRAGKSSWLAMMNLIPYIIEDPEENLQYILFGKQAPEGEEEIIDFIIDFLWTFVDQGNSEAAVTLSQFLANLDEEKVAPHFERLFPILWQSIQDGEPYALELYQMALLHEVVEGDLEALHQEFIAYGLEEFELAIANEFMASLEENNQNPSNGSPNPIRSNVAGGSWDKDQYYEAANAAQEEGDQYAELSAWRSLEDLGDPNGLHNFAISVGQEIGLSVSFMSVDGPTDHAWAPFVAGILQQDMRPGREIAELELLPEAIPTANSPFFKRIIESLEFNFIKYSVVDYAYIAIPYTGENGIQTIFLHCATIDGLESCIISTTLGVDEITTFEGLRPSQSRTLRALFRNAELIFPNTMIDIGDVFSPISDELKPSPFISNFESSTLSYGRFFEFSDFVASIDPLASSMQTLVAGYGISSELSGPHLDTALQGSFQALIQIYDSFVAMHEASEDVMEILFPHTPLRSEVADMLIDKEEITAEPETLSDFLTVLLASDDDEQAQPIIEKGAASGLGELQVVATSMAVAEGDLAKASKWADMALASGYQARFFGDALNNLGWAYLMKKDVSTGMKYLRHSAQQGCANAMSSVTWNLLEEGKFQEARDFFDAHYFSIMSRLDSDEDFAQASNMRSNDALNRWALGASDEEVIAIWSDEKFQEGHAESLFYPLLIQWRNGDKERASAALAALPAHIIAELNDAFAEDRKRVGWFADLSAEAREFLGAGKPKKKGFFSRS